MACTLIILEVKAELGIVGCSDEIQQILAVKSDMNRFTIVIYFQNFLRLSQVGVVRLYLHLIVGEQNSNGA